MSENRQRHGEETGELTSRRSFLGKISKFAIVAGFLGQGAMFVRSLAPNVLYEPLKRFRIGLPKKFSFGVSFLSGERLFVVKDQAGFHSTSAVCTHLGCTVNLHRLAEAEEVTLPDGSKLNQEWEYHCPCHGSKYRGDGTVYDGPAPASLASLHMAIAPDGEIIVDAGKEVTKEFRLNA